MQESTTSGPSAPDNLSDLIRRAASGDPGRPAFHTAETTVTWGEVEDRVDRAARRLAGLVGPGDSPPPRVAIALPDGLDFVVTFFATMRAGLVAVPINPTFTAPELHHVLADSGATLLVATPVVADRLSAGAADLPGLRIVPPDLPDVPGELPGDVPGNALGALLYTSGTEGRPKGAMLTHAALLANHRQLATVQPPVLTRDDVVLLALPLFHAYGLNAGLGAVAFHAASAVLMDRFDPATTLAAIAGHRVTAVLGVPSMYAAWADQRDIGAAMTTVRLAVCGAAPLDPAVAARFEAATGVPVHVGYGLTETSAVLTSTLLSAQLKPGSIGRPLPGVEIVLRAADGQVWPVPAGPQPGDARRPDPADDDWHLDPADADGTDPGEIVVRGGNVFAGYWPDGRGGPDADGWWGTGDVGYADADGDLFLVDRIGELILVNGFNVYPSEIELALTAHPAVADAAVLGVPDPATGQSVRAYVVPATDPPPSEAELLRHCAGRLARFKCPTGIALVDRLPYSAAGKVRKTQLRMEALGG